MLWSRAEGRVIFFPTEISVPSVAYEPGARVSLSNNPRPSQVALIPKRIMTDSQR